MGPSTAHLKASVEWFNIAEWLDNVEWLDICWNKNSATVDIKNNVDISYNQ